MEDCGVIVTRKRYENGKTSGDIKISSGFQLNFTCQKEKLQVRKVKNKTNLESLPGWVG